MSTPFNGNPLRLIRAKCMDCSGRLFREVRLCVVFDCPLWFCRMGKRPSTFLRSGVPWADPAFVQAEADKQLQREMGYWPDVDADIENPQPVGDLLGSVVNQVLGADPDRADDFEAVSVNIQEGGAA